MFRLGEGSTAQVNMAKKGTDYFSNRKLHKGMTTERREVQQGSFLIINTIPASLLSLYFSVCT